MDILRNGQKDQDSVTHQFQASYFSTEIVLINLEVFGLALK
jgi:hypothetical protein